MEQVLKARTWSRTCDDGGCHKARSLGGGAALIATNAVAAAQENQSPEYRLTYLDAKLRDAVALLDAEDQVLLTWRTRDFGEDATFSIDSREHPVH